MYKTRSPYPGVCNVRVFSQTSLFLASLWSNFSAKMEAPLYMCVLIHSLMYEKKKSKSYQNIWNTIFWYIYFSFWFRVKIHFSLRENNVAWLWAQRRLTTILVTNRWIRCRFSWIFLKILEIYSSHLCSHWNVPSPSEILFSGSQFLISCKNTL